EDGLRKVREAGQDFRRESRLRAGSFAVQLHFGSGSSACACGGAQLTAYVAPRTDRGISMHSLKRVALAACLGFVCIGFMPSASAQVVTAFEGGRLILG